MSRIGVRRAKGSGEQRGQESEGTMEDKEDGGAGLFLHQIIDFATAYFAILTHIPEGLSNKSRK